MTFREYLFAQNCKQTKRKRFKTLQNSRQRPTRSFTSFGNSMELRELEVKKILI